mmetsp:Transcript_18785/g.32025  ORF Transcript_18785/g.32025 Transcript_18785/m.32025 type:complete len:219 (-) Transcript_18785:1312-1968(-)
MIFGETATVSISGPGFTTTAGSSSISSSTAGVDSRTVDSMAVDSTTVTSSEDPSSEVDSIATSSIETSTTAKVSPTSSVVSASRSELSDTLSAEGRASSLTSTLTVPSSLTATTDASSGLVHFFNLFNQIRRESMVRLLALPSTSLSVAFSITAFVAIEEFSMQLSIKLGLTALLSRYTSTNALPRPLALTVPRSTPSTDKLTPSFVQSNRNVVPFFA